MTEDKQIYVDIVNFDYDVLEEKYICDCICGGHYEIFEDDLIFGDRTTACSICGQNIIIVNWEIENPDEVNVPL